MLTGIPDVDMIILSNLKDSDLFAVCSVNRYTYNLFNREDFWKRKLQFSSNKDIYKNNRPFVYLLSIKRKVLGGYLRIYNKLIYRSKEEAIERVMRELPSYYDLERAREGLDKLGHIFDEHVVYIIDKKMVN
jgi:glucose-6-phosphate 1-dehydrogenase